jgi:excisionase family DNA binding protein
LELDIKGASDLRKEIMDSTSTDEIMTVKEVSTFLKLAESTVYKLAQHGEIPGRKVGGAWRFSRQQLESWFREPEEGLAKG